MDHFVEVELNFIERVDPKSDIRDALVMSQDIMKLGLGKNYEGVLEAARFVFPKLRFAWLSEERYWFAARFLRDNDFVLDVPCGTGYGAAILASNGNKVLGMDIDAESITLAADKYRYPNVEFVVADMMQADLPAADFITCLDGLEHVSPGRQLIERFVASLSNNGILVVSVPINELRLTQGVQNPYHEENYDYEKLSALLERYFSKVSYFGHDVDGSISGIEYAFDGITAVCEV